MFWGLLGSIGSDDLELVEITIGFWGLLTGTRRLRSKAFLCNRLFSPDFQCNKLFSKGFPME